MMRRKGEPTSGLIPGAVILAVCVLGGRAAGSEGATNVAPQATVTASSQRNDRLAARFVTDGRVPAAGSKQDDGQAWAAAKLPLPDGGTLTFEWREPTRIATVVYYGRTAHGLDLCWKDYEIYADEGAAPVATGSFQRGHGPQPVQLEKPVTARRLTLKFLTHFSNKGSPGASEVQIFTAPPQPGDLIGTFDTLENVAPRAAVTASSEKGPDYAAAFLVDDKFPVSSSKDDAKQAWAADEATHPDGVDLTFTWPEPTPVATLVYYARSAWAADLGWKDYEIRLDDAAAPVATGSFKRGRGPQIVTLPQPARARKLVLKLLTHHASSGSPGADEVQIFTAAPPARLLTGAFTALDQDIRYAYYPSHNVVRLAVPAAPEDATAWQAAVVAANGTPVAQTDGTMPVSKAGVSFAVPDLPAGGYRLVVTFTGGTEPVTWEGPFERRHFEWEGRRLGRDDVVIPPFEPLSVAEETVGCVLRKHAHGPAGLWRQVTTAGRELLAAPLRLEAGGKPVAGDGVTFATVTPTRVAGSAKWQGGSTEFAYDYDGLMELTLRILPGEVERLQLVIPLKAAEAWLMHPVTVELRQHFAGRIPAGAGKVWDSSQVPNLVGGRFLPALFVGGPERGICFAADNDRDWITDPAVPAMEIDRAGDTVNLRLNLIARPATLTRERTIRFALQATPAKPMPESPANWRRWWATATPGGIDDVQINFWGGNQYWGGRYFAVSIFPAFEDFGFWEQLAKHRRTGTVEPEYLETFLAKFAGASEQELANLRAHFKEGLRLASTAPPNAAATKTTRYVIPYTNARGASRENPGFTDTYLDEWQRADVADPGWEQSERVTRQSRRGAVWYDAEPVDSFADMALHYYAKMYETFADGVYWDNFFLKPCFVPAEAGGPAYVDDEGVLRPGVNLMAFRDLVRRNAVMMHVMGKRPLSYIHMTNVNVPPMLSFGTVNLDWEWRDQGGLARADMQDRLGADADTALILAQSLGLQSGNVSVAINRTHEATREWQTRTTLAVCLPHEIKFDLGGKVTVFVQEVLEGFGYGRPDCRVYRYWEEGFPLTTAGANLHALVLAHDGQALIALGNYGPARAAGKPAPVTATEAPSLEDYDAAQRGLKKPAEPAARATAGAKGETYTVRLELDLAALGLPDDAQAYDVELAAGRTKTENLKAIKPPRRPGDEEAVAVSDLGLEEERAFQLRRLAPGVFELRISTHDFALIQVGREPAARGAGGKK
jgi:hypothetical protein